MVSSGIEQDLQRERDLYEFKVRGASSGQPLMTAETDFNRAYPVSFYTARAIANAVPDDIVAHLQPHPETVQDFDKHFETGVGEFILKGHRTGLGSAAAQANAR